MNKTVLAAVTLLSFLATAHTLQCWTCDNARSDEECKEIGSLKQCNWNEDACATETRRGGWWGNYPLMTKRCKQTLACLNNQNQNGAPAWPSTQCNTKLPNSVCRCCCITDGCNELTSEDCGGEKISDNKAKYWGYTGKAGPSYWYEGWEVCNGRSQSPINIVPTSALKDPSLGTFEASMFTKQPDGLILSNNGHSLVLDINNGHTIAKESVLPGIYKVVQLHFHWGTAVNAPGSEHTVDGKYYFGELHIVHMNQAYSSLAEALGKHDGLAVLGFFVEIGDDASPSIEKLLEPVRDGLVTYKGDKYEYDLVETIVQDLIPDDISSYYRYRGSLTTPPCSEAVVWTVFKSTISISLDQANVLLTQLYEKEAESENNVLIRGNYRPTYPLNGRVVRQS